MKDQARAATLALFGELDTVVFLVGIALIVKGASMVSVPAAYVVAGVLLCGLVYLSTRNPK